MKTIFGRKSLPAIENQELVGGADDQCCLSFREGVSWYRRHLCGRSQPHRAAHHGSSADRGGSSRKAKALQGSRDLPNDGASPEPVDDRISDVAVVSATSEASAV